MKKILVLIFIAGLLVSISYAKDQPDLDSLLRDARSGDIDAMCDLGIIYYNGRDTLKDPFKAKCWIKKAYDLGSRRAEKIWKDLSLWQYSGKCEASFDDEPRPKYRIGAVYKEPFTGVEFVFVPKGCFPMGCFPEKKKCRKDETPVHKVCVEGFWIGKYEVSQQQWRDVMGENPSRFNANDSHPVENVSFHDIQKFIWTLNSKTSQHFDLPTEAQWEYACRNAGKKVAFFRENATAYRLDANCGSCNSGDFHGETAPIGSFPPNDLGVYDMAGNVKEWCRDVYDKKAYEKHVKYNPVSEGKGSSRVVRGGSFTDNMINTRCTARDKSIPTMESDQMGFRLVMEKEN